MNKIYRQGDVLLVRVRRRKTAEMAKLPRSGDRLVLELGEVTGHAHAIKAPKADLFEAAGKVFLAVDGEVVALDHEEHETISFSPGLYQRGFQVEEEGEYVRPVSD
jgi:hypothetical protein